MHYYKTRDWHFLLLGVKRSNFGLRRQPLHCLHHHHADDYHLAYEGNWIRCQILLNLIQYKQSISKKFRNFMNMQILGFHFLKKNKVLFVLKWLWSWWREGDFQILEGSAFSRTQTLNLNISINVSLHNIWQIKCPSI